MVSIFAHSVVLAAANLQVDREVSSPLSCPAAYNPGIL